MTTFKDRLNSLLAARSLTYGKLAHAIGASRQSVQTWGSGRSVPTAPNLYKLASYFEVSPDWLKTGIHPEASELTEPVAPTPYEGQLPDDDFVYIPEYRIRFGAGDAPEPTLEEIEDVDAAIYRRRFFQRNRLNPNLCRRATVVGDSMEPVLWDGDKILFEERPEGSEPIKDGAVYAMSYGGSMRVKRLYRKANGDIIIHSDNPKYPDEIITGDERNLIRIYGRVIEKAGMGGL